MATRLVAAESFMVLPPQRVLGTAAESETASDDAGRSACYAASIPHHNSRDAANSRSPSQTHRCRAPFVLADAGPLRVPSRHWCARTRAPVQLLVQIARGE